MNSLAVNVSELSTTSRSSALSAPDTPSPVSAISVGASSVHKEVGFELLERARARHRKDGEVPYPLQYTNLNCNFDAIDYLIFSDLVGGLSFQKFETPPKRVLDLGCGGGMWILAAAQKWVDSTFVGFDIHPRQPDLCISMQDLAKRIQWVHGNFLDLLPFPDADFDFVRLQNVGMGVPEDEWQNVIEEVVRVLKPGGTLEVIEEDILFPCPDSPITKTPRASPTLRGRMKRSHSRSTQETVASEEAIKGDGYEEMLESEKSRSVDTIQNNGQRDQRDHARLKEAFIQMLNARFINPQVLTVLPFYLQASFQDVQALPIMRLYLPPPSGVVYIPDSGFESDNYSSSHLSLESSSSSTLVETASYGSSPLAIRRIFDPTPTASSNPELEALRTRMHLARTIEMVRGCKHLIWKEYEKIHGRERKDRNNRLDRDDFEAYFYNWECDMQDRCGMRELIQSNLGWPLPPHLPKPSWSDWREKGDTEDVESFYRTAPPELLRALRGFVCKRPVHIIRSGPPSS